MSRARMILGKERIRDVHPQEATLKIGISLAILFVCLGIPTHPIWGQDESTSPADPPGKQTAIKPAQSGETNQITSDSVEVKESLPSQKAASNSDAVRTPITMRHGGAELADCAAKMDCFLKAFDDRKPAVVRFNKREGESGFWITQKMYLEISNFTADHGTLYWKLEERNFEFTHDYDQLLRQGGMGKKEIADLKKKTIAGFQLTGVEETACLFQRDKLRVLLQKLTAGTDINSLDLRQIPTPEKCEGWNANSVAAQTPESAPPAATGGQVYIRGPAQTEKELRLIVKEHPGDAEPHYLLGSALIAQNRTDEALAEFRTVLELNPRHQLAWGDMGIIYQGMHNLEKAAEYYNKAIEFAPSDQRPYINLCAIYLEKEQNEKTAKFCEAAVKISPNSAGVWNNLAWLYASAKDPQYRNPEKALEYAQKGVSLSGATIPEMLDTLALAYSLNFKWAEAVEAEKKALQLRPGDVSFQEALARYQRAK